MPVLETVATTLEIISTAISLLSHLEVDYGVAIQIDNWFADVNLLYEDYYLDEGVNKQAPKQTLKMGTTDVAGAFGGDNCLICWNDGTAGSVRYKIEANNDTICLDIIWAQSADAFIYHLPGPVWDKQICWNGYAVLIGLDVCKYSVKSNYKKVKDYIKNINEQYDSIEEVAEYDTNIQLRKNAHYGHFIAGYEERGLHRNDVISYDVTSRQRIDIKVSMDDQDTAGLMIEIGPEEYWKSSSYSTPLYKYDPDHASPVEHFVYVYPNKTIRTIIVILMAFGGFYLIKIFYHMMRYCKYFCCNGSKKGYKTTPCVDSDYD